MLTNRAVNPYRASAHCNNSSSTRSIPSTVPSCPRRASKIMFPISLSFHCLWKVHSRTCCLELVDRDCSRCLTGCGENGLYHVACHESNPSASSHHLEYRLLYSHCDHDISLSLLSVLTERDLRLSSTTCRTPRM